MVTLPRPQRFTSRLGFIQKVSSKVYLKRFDLVEPKEITFLPGQTVMLQVAPASPAGGPGVNRSMSIASPPSEKTSILVAHDVSPMGPYSQWTLKAKVGDPMNFIGPLGAFILDAESPRRRVFVATGTGVAPFRSMLLDQLSGAEVGTPWSRDGQGPDLQGIHKRLGAKAVTGAAYAVPPRALSPFHEFVLYWGLRREEDIFWKDEFEELAVKYPNFKFVLTLSQPSESWVGRKGRVGDHVFVDEQNLMGCDYYLCGNKPMVSEMEAALLAKGVPKEHIKKELFY